MLWKVCKDKIIVSRFVLFLLYIIRLHILPQPSVSMLIDSKRSFLNDEWVLELVNLSQGDLKSKVRLKIWKSWKLKTHFKKKLKENNLCI